MSMDIGSKKVKSDINVTPLVDVVLVLLIIFMVITPMLQKGVDVVLPKAGNTKERKEEQKTITVAVKNDASRSTYIGGNKLDKPEDLVPQLKERLEEIPEGQRLLYLKADQNLPYGDVMKVMDYMREAGVEEIALIAEQKVQS